MKSLSICRFKIAFFVSLLRCFTKYFKYSSCHIHLLSVDFCERSDFGASFSHLFGQQQTLSPAMAPQRVAKATRGAATLPSSLWTAGALCLVAVGGSKLQTVSGSLENCETGELKIYSTFGCISCNHGHKHSHHFCVVIISHFAPHQPTSANKKARDLRIISAMACSRLWPIS